ncbi:MAG: hypothetical protein ACR2IV_08365 [Bryobacteraceae bacterium]
MTSEKGEERVLISFTGELQQLAIAQLLMGPSLPHAIFNAFKKYYRESPKRFHEVRLDEMFLLK